MIFGFAEWYLRFPCGQLLIQQTYTELSVPGNTVTEEGTAHPLEKQLSNPDDTFPWPTAE